MRLLRKYYASETALPADLKQVQRLVGARTPAERAAVEAMLEEYFALDDDGWHNTRCDEEIEAHRLRLEAEAGRREGTNERKARSRALRKGQFAELAKHGIKLRWDAKPDEIQAALSRVTGRDSHAPVTPPVTDRSRFSHSPFPIPHSPDTTHKSGTGVTGGAVNGTGTPPEPPPDAPGETPPPPTPPAGDTRARWLAVRDAYPRNTHAEADWLLAEREAVRAVDDGLCTWDHWFNAATRYAAQVRAMRREGTQFVTKPSNWFRRDRRSWGELFPLPGASASPPSRAPLTVAQIERDIAAGLRDADGSLIAPGVPT